MMDKNTQLKRNELSRQEEEKERENAALIGKYYGHEQVKKMGKKTHPKPYIFSLEDLDNDSVIEIVINNPAYNRNPDVFEKNAKFSESVTVDKQDAQQNIIIF
jgi:hypothetical protein